MGTIIHRQSQIHFLLTPAGTDRYGSGHTLLPPSKYPRNNPHPRNHCPRSRLLRSAVHYEWNDTAPGIRSYSRTFSLFLEEIDY